MNIEELSEEERLKRDKSLYPPFIVKSLADVREEIRIEEKTGKPIPYNPTKITDFTPLIHCIWKISNKSYQEKYWARQEAPIICDNYMETMEIFLSDGEAVLEANTAGRVSMTFKQREMLQKLYEMVEDFEWDDDTPEDPGYGVNDAEIIKHPKWHKIQDYAKLVYEELSGDDLDAWEKSRPKQAKPLDVPREEITSEEWISEKKKIYPHYLLQCEEKAIGDESLYCFVVDVLFQVWEMSNQEFQERFWVGKKRPIYDNKNCAKTVANFFYGAGVLIGNEKYLTSKQSENLQKLCDLLNDFEKDPTKPQDPGFGINDAEIIKHPKWEKIREYAKHVYKMLSISGLDG